MINLGGRILAGTRHDVFQEVGGFDESLPDAFADIGLCLKVRRAGYLIVYTPFAKLYKHETRADKIDMGSEAIMRERWPTLSGAILIIMEIFLANVPISR
jgi:GT2 family glycosyltransferase